MMIRKKDGFISMSLVYSFFVVFVAISVSLLAVYTVNLSLVRNVNKEIKSFLIKKGNEDVIVFNNLIIDGSFERDNTWVQKNNVGNEYSKITSKHKYYGQKGLEHGKYYGTKRDSITSSKEPIEIVQGDVYYLERIYEANTGLEAGQNKLKLVSASNSSVFFDFGSPFSDVKTTASGWNIYSTVDYGAKRFNLASGKYYFSIETYVNSDHDNKIKQADKSDYFFSDGYILVDLTAAFGKEKVDKVFNQADGNKILSKRVHEIINHEYFDGRKMFSIYHADIV